VKQTNGTITNTFDFESKGDYEGIEQVGNKVYVSDNSGDIYVYKIEKQKKSKKRYKTHLSSKNNVEGLTYDPRHNELLLACKGDPGKDMKKGKSIYAFDLEKKKLQKKPKYRITDAQIIKHLDQKLKNKISKSKLKRFKERAKEFAPSALTVQANNGKIFILSSRGKLIIVINKAGVIDEIYFLKENLFIQPEGICIDKDLTLYISSEGKKQKSKLFAFKYLEHHN